MGGATRLRMYQNLMGILNILNKFATKKTAHQEQTCIPTLACRQDTHPSQTIIKGCVLRPIAANPWAPPPPPRFTPPPFAFTKFTGPYIHAANPFTPSPTYQAHLRVLYVPQPTETSAALPTLVLPYQPQAMDRRGANKLKQQYCSPGTRRSTR